LIMFERIENIQHVVLNGKKRTVFDFYKHDTCCGKHSIVGWYKKPSTILKHWHNS